MTNQTTEETTAQSSEILNQLLEDLSFLQEMHSPHCQTYNEMAEKVKPEVEKLFSGNDPADVQPFGTISLPFHNMGAIDSRHLWCMDELILFSFYYQNRDRYKCTLDIGANLGLHSIIMSRCGYKVTAFEPDPTHYDILMKNLNVNDCQNVTVEKAAVSDKNGTQEFVRILGNTTSSHLTGAKDDAYGPTETFSVRTQNIAEVLNDVDLIKMDVEGHEAVILKCIPNDAFKCTDVVMEVGSEKNAEIIYSKFKDTNVNLFAQKQQWKKVTCLEEMPTSYRDGSLFVSSKEAMPW